jgi:hypothetical protein
LGGWIGQVEGGGGFDEVQTKRRRGEGRLGLEEKRGWDVT